MKSKIITNTMQGITKPWREIVDPSSSTISQVRRCSGRYAPRYLTKEHEFESNRYPICKTYRN
jgi:hypothetical protein